MPPSTHFMKGFGTIFSIPISILLHNIYFLVFKLFAIRGPATPEFHFLKWGKVSQFKEKYEVNSTDAMWQTLCK